MSNKKLLIVKEFDFIICNPNYKEDLKYKYLPKEVFEELKKFIHTYVPDEENTDVLEFFREGYHRYAGDFIQVKNYIGLIQMKSGFQIQILPKIDFDTEEDFTETIHILIRMLRSMKDFPGKAFHYANLSADKTNLYELFISMYLYQVRELTKRGLKSAYVEQEENLNYFKGKLMIKNHLKKNHIHQERFYVTYDSFQINRAENKLIKATLEKLRQLSTSSENKKTINRLLIYFEYVEASINYQKDFSQVLLDKNTKDYKALMVWSKVFLLDKSFTAFSGDSYARALLFPMEKLFEAYVAKYMKKILENIGWEVSVQDKGHYLFKLEERDIFALRPDIVITCTDGHQIIMDTKWKRLTEKSKTNYGISQQDMYQMYAYAKKYESSQFGIPDVWLIYPKNSKIDYELKLECEDGVNVFFFFVDIANIEESLLQLKEKLVAFF